MANTDTASIIPLHQPARPQTPAERARAYRRRKRQKAAPVKSVTPIAKPVTPSITPPVTPSRRQIAPTLLTTVAFGLAGAAITMNGWYSYSLGSSPVSAWVFCAIGVAADLMALAIPACAAAKWQARERGAALAGWLVWLITLIFVITAGIGFASVNISDVTALRASRVTPAVTTTQLALTDAVTARDRECRGGVGKFCRERELAVNEQRKALEVAMRAVEKDADPQTEAARRIVAWLSAGTIQPTGDDFAMLRMILLALLPQIGGILLMLGRR